MRLSGLKRMSWRLTVLTVIAYFASSGNAYADNYNFYFTKPPKKKGQQTEQMQENSDESSEEEEVAKEPVTPPPPLVNPNTQTLTVPSSQQPIIINNTNNVGYPTQPSVPLAPLTREAQPEPEAFHDYRPDTKVSTLVLPAYQEQPRSNWRMGLSGILLLSEVTRAYESSGSLYTYDSKEENWGGLVTLGWDITKVMGLNFYGGATHGNYPSKVNFHYGADLQLMPLRVPLKNFDLIEFGFLVGGSNIMAARDNVGTLHAGAKLNVNFGKDYGFTASTRANFGHFLFEAGFVARI